MLMNLELHSFVISRQSWIVAMCNMSRVFHKISILFAILSYLPVNKTIDGILLGMHEVVSYFQMVL
jgi:hypothetical protein